LYVTAVSASATAIGGSVGSKVAVTATSAPIVTTQEAVPVQPPDQPAKTDPEPGAAVSVTCVP
jgi:hypothetical protein